MKYFKYLKYVLRHKWFVFVECFKRGLIWRGLVHDLSKFHPFEFISYARWFNDDMGFKFMNEEWDDHKYWTNETHHKIRRDFELAWLFHQKKNKHHWQYWILLEDGGDKKVLDMPEIYMIEMVCDWIGAGKAIHGKNDTKDWYKKNWYKMTMSEKTKEYVEKLINDHAEKSK